MSKQSDRQLFLVCGCTTTGAPSGTRSWRRGANRAEVCDEGERAFGPLPEGSDVNVAYFDVVGMTDDGSRYWLR